MVAAFHLLDRPEERGSGSLGIGDDRRDQVRNVIEEHQLHHFGIDHEELHFIGAGVVEDAHQEAVEADSLAGPCGAGDEQVRPGAKIADHRLARNIFADGKGQRRGHLLKLTRGKDLFQVDGRGGGVWHIDSHGSLAGDGRDHMATGGLEHQRQIIGERDDPGDLHAGRRGQLIPCDRRAAIDVDATRLNAEFFQGLFQHPGMGLGIFAKLPLGRRWRRHQKIKRRQLKPAWRLPRASGGIREDFRFLHDGGRSNPRGSRFDARLNEDSCC